jgi:predicted nucleic acid-binding protein
MKGDRAFLDTNILLYVLAQGDPRRAIAEELLASGSCVIGVQTLNEFIAVALRKLSMPWVDVIEALGAIRTICPDPIPLTVQIHDKALEIVGRYQYHIYDSLVIAAALEASCQTLFSEDMHDGQVIEGLTIRNPFLKLEP